MWLPNAGFRMSAMKIKHSRGTARHAAVSILIIVLLIAAAGCGSYSSGGGGGNAPYISGLGVSSGPVGTSVTITGTNFGATQGSSTVKFNGTAATPTSWGATSIAAQVPAGATTGNVVVTVGGVASNGVPFTVNTSTTASWTYVQDSLITGCVAGQSSCNLGVGQMLPTTAGTVWVVEIQTTTNVTITSVTGGGGSWQLCPASSCHI